MAPAQVGCEKQVAALLCQGQAATRGEGAPSVSTDTSMGELKEIQKQDIKEMYPLVPSLTQLWVRATGIRDI